MIDILESQAKLIHSLENSLNAIMRTGFTKADETCVSYFIQRISRSWNRQKDSLSCLW
jgi:hypothetical protein